MSVQLHSCPYCGEALRYIGLDSDIDRITEEWRCDTCQEFVYFDEPGLRPTEEKIRSPMKTKTLNTKVAGVTFEGRQSHIARLNGSEPCRLQPEPDNRFDPNAIAVHVAKDGQVLHVGYLPKEIAAQVSPMLDGEAVMAQISEITGGFEIGDGDYAPLGLRLQIEIPAVEAG